MSLVNDIQFVLRLKSVEEEYESLVYMKNKVLATVLWDVESIKQCVIDYKSRNIKKYKLTVLAEIDEEDIEEDIDWELLAETGKLTVLDIQPN